MFGYIRPLRGELKVEAYEQYRAVYCGLCRTLAKRCGYAARFAVNFDFTYFAMVISASKSSCSACYRCPAHPLRGRQCMQNDPALETAADRCMILTWWKLRDAIADERFPKRLAARLGCLCLRRGYRRARAREQRFDEVTRRELEALAALERENCASLDIPADAFASILAAASENGGDGTRQRVIEQLIYHTGRIVYLLDAIDDLAEDFSAGKYNPLIGRFSLEEGKLSDEQKDTLRRTLSHSANCMGSALQLLEAGPYTEILSNIVYLGVPAACGSVLAGTWKRTRTKREREHTDE